MRLFLGMALLAVAAPAAASDHSNLEEGFPIRIEDAYPVGQNAIEVQLHTSYVGLHDDPEGDFLVEVSPRIEWGAFRNFQLTLEAPYFLGDGSKADSGEVAIEGLYNFNTEGLALPAFAVAGGFNKPYGQDGPDGGLESQLSILATKSFGTPEVSGDSPLAYVPRQLHLNATWFHNFDPLPDEREDRYLVGIGYSQPVTNNLVLVTDVFRETDREDGKANNIAEIGGRYVLTPQTILSAGAGVGFGGERTEDFRVIVGLQHALSFPYAGPSVR